MLDIVALQLTTSNFKQLFNDQEFLKIGHFRYHKNEADSVFQQTRYQGYFYTELHNMGMYINQPDEYFYYGANKAGKP